MLSCRFRTQTVAPWDWDWNCNAIRSDNPTRPNKSSQKQGWGSRVCVHTNSRHLLRSQRAAGVQTCTKCHFMSASAPQEFFFFFFTLHADCSKCLTGDKGWRPRMTASQETQRLVVWIPGSLTQSSLMITSLMDIFWCDFSIWHNRLKRAISWPWETRCRRPHRGELYKAKPPVGLFSNKNLILH